VDDVIRVPVGLKFEAIRHEKDVLALHIGFVGIQAVRHLGEIFAVAAILHHVGDYQHVVKLVGNGRRMRDKPVDHADGAVRRLPEQHVFILRNRVEIDLLHLGKHGCVIGALVWVHVAEVFDGRDGRVAFVALAQQPDAGKKRVDAQIEERRHRRDKQERKRAP